jgi:hypothetical protein
MGLRGIHVIGLTKKPVLKPAMVSPKAVLLWSVISMCVKKNPISALLLILRI